MVTVTTKTINHNITKGNRTNNVHATITSTPGLNTRACRSKLMIIKLVQLILMIGALTLLLLHMRRNLYYRTAIIRGSVFYYGMVVTAVVSLVVFVFTYVLSTTTWILVTRASILEIWYNLIMGLTMSAASFLAIVYVAMSDMEGEEYYYPLVASILGIVTGILYLVAVVIARRDLQGTARSPYATQIPNV